MKSSIFVGSFLVAILAFGVIPAAAQDKIIILLRHAEKDTNATMSEEKKADPELSEAGKERALRLIKVVGKHKPGAFYSTNFKRTRQTLEPFAEKRHKTVQIYDDRQGQQLADTILKSNIRTTVIVGHSNTIPGLANLITKKELFKNMNDAEFGVVWVIRMKDGVFKRMEVVSY